MNKLEQAAQALLAHWDTPAWKYLKPTGDLMADLREALAEQEPVAWYSDKGGFNECGEGKPLYAAPVRTKDLTDDEIRDVVSHPMTMMKLNDARAVIAKLKEKTNG